MRRFTCLEAHFVPLVSLTTCVFFAGFKSEVSASRSIHIIGHMEKDTVTAKRSLSFTIVLKSNVILNKRFEIT